MKFVPIFQYRGQDYGSKDSKTGKWSGLIGAVADHEVDIAIGMFTLIKKRLDVIDFSIPMINSAETYIYVKIPEKSSMRMEAYLNVKFFT